MSDEDGPVFSPQTSPVTSPVRCTPPTSPPSQRSPPTSEASNQSPATSPLHSTSSSSSPLSPLKRGVKRKPHRTTLQRKSLRFQSGLSEDDSNLDKENDTNVGEENDWKSSENQECTHQHDSHVEDCFFIEDKTDSDNENNQSDNFDECDIGTSDSDSESSGNSSTVLSKRLSSNARSRGSSNELSCDYGDGGEESGTTLLSLFSGAPTSANEGLLSVLKLYVEERWTKESFDKTIKTFKRILPQPNEMPSNGRAAFKRLSDLTSSFSEVPYLFCENCLQLISTVNDSCDHSGGVSKFYLFPLDQQIKHMFEQRGLSSVIESYRNHPSRKAGLICDILDGTEYLKIKNHFPNPFDLLLLWNTDGVAMSGSSKLDLWPILATICEVPPRLRSSFMLVAGIYVFGKDPNMNVYLAPFVESLKSLCEKGVEWIHPVSKELITSRITAPVISADAPAKAKVLQMQQHGSSFSCVICEQEAALTEPILLRDGKLRRLRRFMFHEQESRVRTAERMDRLGAKAERVGKAQKGVLGNTVISQIPHLDRGFCSSAEYMHLILLGIVKYLLLIIFFKKGPWYIGNKIPEMDVFLKSIKVPDTFNRLARKICDLKYWKASELRAFLLFYSLPLFKERLPKKYFDHWMLLVAAIFILLKESISNNDLCQSELMLKSFVRDIKLLYGEKCYTYNMHNVLHLITLVKRWGPLWATSAFAFETFNGYLSAHAHGTKNLGQELINNIKIAQGVAILENIVNVEDYDHHKFSLNVTEPLGTPLLKDILSFDEAAAIDSCTINIGCYVLYARAKIMSKVYTTKSYDEKVKRANSIVQFDRNERDEYGQIVYFIKSENATLYCLVHVYKIEQVELYFHEETMHIVDHLLPVLLDKLVVIPVQTIKSKVVKMGNYIGTPPNSYEVHL